MLSAVTSYMYSKLGSNSSLLPLAIKDVANSVGITAGSYVTGKDVESKDRFIDEFGFYINYFLFLSWIVIEVTGSFTVE